MRTPASALPASRSMPNLGSLCARISSSPLLRPWTPPVADMSDGDMWDSERGLDPESAEEDLEEFVFKKPLEEDGVEMVNPSARQGLQDLEGILSSNAAEDQRLHVSRMGSKTSACFGSVISDAFFSAGEDEPAVIRTSSGGKSPKGRIRSKRLDTKTNVFEQNSLVSAIFSNAHKKRRNKSKTTTKKFDCLKNDDTVSKRGFGFGKVQLAGVAGLIAGFSRACFVTPPEVVKSFSPKVDLTHGSHKDLKPEVTVTLPFSLDWMKDFTPTTPIPETEEEWFKTDVVEKENKLRPQVCALSNRVLRDASSSLLACRLLKTGVRLFGSSACGTILTAEVAHGLELISSDELTDDFVSSTDSDFTSSDLSEIHRHFSHAEGTIWKALIDDAKSGLTFHPLVESSSDVSQKFGATSRFELLDLVPTLPSVLFDSAIQDAGATHLVQSALTPILGGVAGTSVHFVESVAVYLAEHLLPLTQHELELGNFQSPDEMKSLAGMLLLAAVAGVSDAAFNCALIEPLKHIEVHEQKILKLLAKWRLRYGKLILKASEKFRVEDEA